MYKTGDTCAPHMSASNTMGSGSDFANYRIKWTADVESFFQKKLKKTPSRKLVPSGEESEEERKYDPDHKAPIRKPSPNNMAR